MPRPDRPYLLLDSPSSLAHTSAGDVVSVSGQHTTRVSQGDQHETAAHTGVQVSGQHTSLYTHEGELQVKATAGPVSLHAHSDTLEILADQSVQILSVNDSIRIQAKDKIEIVAGDSTLVLRGGDIDFFTPGTFLIKSAIHDFKGGGSGPAVLPALPQGKTDEPPTEIELNYDYDDLTPVQGAAYKVTFEDGTVRQGKLDASGYALLSGVPKGRYKVELGEDQRPWDPDPSDRLDEAFFKGDKQSAGAAAIERALEHEPTRERTGKIPKITGVSNDQRMLHYLLSDSSDKRGTQMPLMQMGRSWVRDRAKREGLPSAARNKLIADQCERRTVLVTFESAGALDHAQAMPEAMLRKPQAEMHPHEVHGTTKVWGASEIDEVDDARRVAHQSKSSSTAAAQAGNKPSKSRKL
nr:DUF2345 domain-containing protein [Inhella proteolytica]